MLNFRPIGIDDEALIKKYYNKNYFLCEYCFVDLFIWRGTYNTQIAEYNNFLYTKMTDEGIDYFFAPFGEGDFNEAMNELFKYTKEKSIPLNLISLPPEIKDLVEETFPNTFEFKLNEDNMDYVYLSEKLAYLKGKKLHKKKNHINRFLKDYENRWTYEDVTEDNIREFFSYQVDWCEDNNEFLGELCATSSALKNFKKLNLIGGIIRVDGKIIAITLGSKPYEDTVIVHIEKADYTINGAYQIINQQFVLHNCLDVKYVDREEDLGIEGLRKAKESYYPEFKTENYIGIPK
ncbi:MAG: DUF2156 domain-containing protein [Lachnospirales bacterium]